MTGSDVGKHRSNSPARESSPSASRIVRGSASNAYREKSRSRSEQGPPRSSCDLVGNAVSRNGASRTRKSAPATRVDFGGRPRVFSLGVDARRVGGDAERRGALRAPDAENARVECVECAEEPSRLPSLRATRLAGVGTPVSRATRLAEASRFIFDRSNGATPTRLNRLATILCLTCRSSDEGAERLGPVFTSMSHGLRRASSMMSNP